MKTFRLSITGPVGRRLAVALTLVWVLAGTGAPSVAHAQEAYLGRLPEVGGGGAVPSARIAGLHGTMRVTASSCPSFPLSTARRRIVELSAQEWAYFGFSVTDRMQPPDRDEGTNDPGWSSVLRSDTWRRLSRDFSRIRGSDFSRIVPSIAGYWAATPDGAVMLERQNALWNRSNGIGTRWRDPWSAAFVSWVMCEEGIADVSSFQRSIAHREYIDQAIRSRDGAAPDAAFVAYDMGEAEIVPGDLLCSGTRSGYRTIDQRRKQMGLGASTHCDAVVSVDSEAGVILAIGGNVRRSVSLKRLPAVRELGVHLHPRDNFFAHLKLRTDAIQDDALMSSRTISRMACEDGFEPPKEIDVLGLDLDGVTC